MCTLSYRSTALLAVWVAAGMKTQQLGCVFSGILGILSAWARMPGLLHLYYWHSDQLDEATYPSKCLEGYAL